MDLPARLGARGRHPEPVSRATRRVPPSRSHLEVQLTGHLSHSALEDFSTCGEKYRLGRVLKLPKRPGWALAGGSTFHDITEEWDWQQFGRPAQGTTDFLERFSVLVSEIEEQSEYPQSEWYCGGRKSKDAPNKEDRKWWEKHGPTMMVRYINWRQNSPLDIYILPSGEPAIEVGGTALIEGIPFQFHVDRIEQDRRTGELLINDLKTGSREPGATQVQRYRTALSVAGVLGSESPIEWGAYWMAREGKLTSPVDLSALPEGQVEYEVQETWKAVQAGMYGPARPGPLCGSCSVSRFCYTRGGQEMALPWAS